MLVLPNLLENSTNLMTGTIGGTGTRKIVNGELVVTGLDDYIAFMILRGTHIGSPEKTYCVGWIGSVNGQSQIYAGRGTRYINTISDGDMHYVIASGLKETFVIHIKPATGTVDFTAREFFAVESNRLPGIIMPHESKLTPEQIATLPPYGDFKEILPL